MPSVEPGTRLGAYEIVAPIGAGGMGEVWRAHDTRLGRDVAVKILPDSFLDNPDRLARFEREAKSAGGLNHPNLLTIHELGVSDGRFFIVSELLDGSTLREKMSGGPLSPRRAIEYAAQIAEGLAAAHEHGVVHRDLKPENIFVTRDGRLKILDFGLAKLTSAPSSAMTGAPTAKQVTDPGTVLGTVGYMSPEQVRGENVDARSDIFALGVILYEMVSGRRAFRGTSSIDTMHAILHEDPPELLQTNAQIPPALQRIVHHCLEKDPEQRFQSARDLAFDLSSMSGSSAELIAPKTRARPPAATLWIAAIVIAAIAGWFASRAMQRPPKMPAFRRVTFHSLGVPAAAFSADQQSVVFSSVGDRRAGDIYVSAIGSPEMRPMGLPGACVLATSKNGELAVLLDPHFLGGFLIPGTLARVPLGGGAPRQLANDVQWADWTPDGNDLMILREVGGKTRIELPIGNVVFETTSWISTPRMSPDGKSIAFIEHPQAGNDAGFIAVIGPDHKKKTLTPPYASAFGLAWHPDGKEVWYTAAESGNARQLWAVGLSGAPRLVIQMPGIAQIHDIARDGRVLLTQNDTHIRLFARGPNDFNDRELSWLDWSLLRDVSADGRWILFDESGEGGGKAGGVYIRNADGSPAVRLGDGLAAGFSPDGKSVLARHFNEKPGQIYLYPIGPGDARQLTHDDLDHEFTSWVPDGKSIAFRASVAGRPPRLYVQSVAGGAPRPISPEGVSGYLICSPDGRWVHSRGPDRAPTLYRTDGGAEIKLPAMVPEAVVIGWSPDGNSLRYYLRSANPAPVYTFEVATGRSRLWKEIALPERNFGAGNVRTSADGKTYGYSIYTNSANLYLLEGVK